MHGRAMDESGHSAPLASGLSAVPSIVPEFLSLNVKPRGGPGTVVGVWTEAGGRELTFADLSDGTLRFLCWAVLCLSPTGPPLMCIDEPELGLHPRVLPVLARFDAVCRGQRTSAGGYSLTLSPGAIFFR